MAAIAWSYVPFIADDALISFRYSRQLLDGHGLTFTTGEHVEGYSNLLWVLLVAAGGLLSRDLILVGRVLGLVCVAAACVAIGWTCQLRSRRWTAAACAGLFTIAFSRGAALWAIGGLEQALQIGLLAWAIALVAGRHAEGDVAADDVPMAASGLLALLVLTRPDGALFCVLMAIGLAITHGPSARTLRGVLRLAWLPAIAWLGQEAFRLVYYHDWLPNTAYVKLGASTNRFVEGVQYLGKALAWYSPIVLIAAIGLFNAGFRRQRAQIIPLIVAVGWCAYVVFIGGDIFPGHRHFMPVVVCLAFLIIATWRGSEARLPRAVLAVALVVVGAVYPIVQYRDPANFHGYVERWEWDCGLIASDLRQVFEKKQPLVAVDALGCNGYFSTLPMLDMLGLADRYIAHHRPADFGEGQLGHELGDEHYVLSREPDLVVFGTNGGREGVYPAGKRLVALPEFQRQYSLVEMHVFGIPDPVTIWARWTSPRIGVTRTANEVRIPGYLVATPGAAMAMRLRDAFVARISAGRTVTFRLDSLPPGPGPWTARATGRGEIHAVVEGSAVKVTTGANDVEVSEVVLTTPYSTAGFRATGQR